MRRWAVMASLVMSVACGSAEAAQCPGQFDPSKLTEKELREHNIAEIPTSEGSSFERVRAAVETRQGFIKDNYADVESVDVGRGWGLSYTQDQYGDITFHRKKDSIVTVVVAKESSCPDPERGKLFLIADDGTRVPVRFDYLPD